MSRKTLFALLVPAIAVYCCAVFANGQRFAPGYCPTVTAHENFDKTRFFGNWIEVEKTPSIFDLMMRCLVVDYSDDQDNTVNVVVRGISLAGLPLTVNGDGLLQDVHRSGFYSIRYGFGVPFQGTLTTIIDTDYDDYAVVYSCTNSLLSGVFHSEYIWVLSRSGKISNPTRQNIYEKLDKLQINRSGLTMSDRATCPTNSSTIGRESDKDLASQLTGAAAAVPATGANGVEGGAGAAPAGSEVASEPTQKSVVIPLLYDSPSPLAPSIGGSKLSSVKASPAADKVAAKPQQAAPLVLPAIKPQQQQPAQAQVQPQQQPQQAQPQPQLVVGQQQQLAASGASASPPNAAAIKPGAQQPAQQGAGSVAKVQQKP